MGLFDKLFGTYSEGQIKRISPLADRIEALYTPEGKQLMNQQNIDALK